jgi:hypothetical protein
VTDKGDTFVTYLHGSIFPHIASQATLCPRICLMVSSESERLAQIGSKTKQASVPEGALAHPVRIIATVIVSNFAARIDTSLNTLGHRLELV